MSARAMSFLLGLAYLKPNECNMDQSRKLKLEIRHQIEVLVQVVYPRLWSIYTCRRINEAALSR